MVALYIHLNTIACTTQCSCTLISFYSSSFFSFFVFFLTVLFLSLSIVLLVRWRGEVGESERGGSGMEVSPSPTMQCPVYTRMYRYGDSYDGLAGLGESLSFFGVWSRESFLIILGSPRSPLSPCNGVECDTSLFSSRWIPPPSFLFLYALSRRIGGPPTPLRCTP